MFEKIILLNENYSIFEIYFFVNIYIKQIGFFYMTKLFDDLLETIAKLICGDADEYPYRSSSALTRFFNSIGYTH